ncbi:nucleotidyltransferase domain-containing protein [Rhizobium leguminosarum]|uniref:nucleotidyltransferase domain-containing protein n=1 Tax=Rhizobium leguminosarum TaxID=384 RepID=UPI001FE0BC8F|nr:nucleotidyltransferase domain-containing protein [Rhizobium leguminosarum]
MARPNPESALRFPLSTILGNETNVRVMRELSLHGGQLSVGNLVNRTKISRPPILASLATLASFQIVTESGTGYARLFSLNRGSPFSIPVQILFETEENRFAHILAAVKECASLFGDKVVAAWVFGSVARGEDNASSDLDVALIAHAPDIETIQNGSIDFIAAKGKELSFSPSINTLSITDLKRLRQSGDPLWQAFLNEGLVVLGPRPESIPM